MKKSLSILFFFAILACGCSEEELLINETALSENVTFTATFEQNESRTYVEDGNLLCWTKGDQISLFQGNTLNYTYKFDGETGDNDGTFSYQNKPFGSAVGLDCNYAVYPYSSDTKIAANGEITTILPAVQNYAENSFGLGANVMVAATMDTDDTVLKFKNVGGCLKLQLYGDDVTVKTITLTGNNKEKLAGKAIVKATYGQVPTLSMADDATETIILECGEKGVKIGTTEETATAFWMTVPPTTFTKGFTLTVTDVDGNEFSKSTTRKVEVKRNVIKPMDAFNARMVIPNNQIWYTSSNGKIVTPKTADVFGATIKSNVYEDGMGIITFDGDVTQIGKYSFYYCQTLTSITIPNSVTTIGHYAFTNCNLTDITIPNSVTKIGDNAFSSNEFTGITIPSSVTQIGIHVFINCKVLENIVVESGNPVYDSRNNCNAVIETGTNTLVVGCKNTNIPDNVTTISSHALCFSLITSITIPKSVTKISDYAFTNCESLSSIVVETGNPVYDSRNNCNAIIETGTNTLVVGCKNTIIPESVTKIGNNAFWGRGKLTSITIPENVTSIGSHAFYNCESLTSITIPDHVTSIGSDAFYSCTALKNVTIGNSVKSIGSYAFTRCKSITSITIPSSVSSIGNDAFSSCSSLVKVDVEAITPPTISSDTFEECNSNIKFYVPAESLDDYKSATHWKDLSILADNQ